MTDVTNKNTIVPFFSFKVNMLNLTWKEKQKELLKWKKKRVMSLLTVDRKTSWVYFTRINGTYILVYHNSIKAAVHSWAKPICHLHVWVSSTKISESRNINWLRRWSSQHNVHFCTKKIICHDLGPHLKM